MPGLGRHGSFNPNGSRQMCYGNGTVTNTQGRTLSTATIKVNKKLLNNHLKEKKATQIILKYAEQFKKRLYNPFSPQGRSYILRKAGFTKKEINNYEKNGRKPY